MEQSVLVSAAPLARAPPAAASGLTVLNVTVGQAVLALAAAAVAAVCGCMALFLAFMAPMLKARPRTPSRAAARGATPSRAAPRRSCVRRPRSARPSPPRRP